MAAVPEELRSIVIGALSAEELAGCVAYLCLTPLAAGQTLAVPHQPLSTGRDAYVAFIDADPGANWGHACRYLLIDAQSGEVSSHQRRFPVFAPGDNRWQVVHGPAAKPH